MNRRELIGSVAGTALLGLPSFGTAETLPGVVRLGMVGAVPRTAPGWTAFQDRLNELGYGKGRVQAHFVQIAEGTSQPEALRDATEQLDIVVAGGPEATLKAVIERGVRSPIVMVAIDYDPVAGGYVAGLSRPSGNITGVVFQQVELTGKRIALLQEAVPGLRRVALFWDVLSKDQGRAAQEAAASLGIDTVSIEFHDQPYDYGAAIERAIGQEAGAVVVLSSPVFFRERMGLGQVALQHRLPLVSPFREITEAAGLMSYGANIPAMYRRAAELVDKILRGAKPAEIPVEQPIKFEFVLNLKVAKALDLTMPTTLLARADEVID